MLEELLAVPCVVMDAQGILLEATTPFFSWSGHQENAVSGQPFSNLLAGREKRAFSQYLRRVRSAGPQPVPGRFHLNHQDGTGRAVQVVSRLFQTAHGPRIKAALLDRTIEEQAQQAGESSHEIIQSLLLTVNHPLILLGERLVILGANSAFCALVQRAPDALLGQPLDLALNFWWDQQLLRQRLELTARDGSPVENFLFEAELGAGDRRTLRVQARRATVTGPQGPVLVVSLEDLTDSQRLEQQVRALQTQLDREVENAPLALYRLTPEGRIRRANSFVCQSTGYSGQELCGRPITELTADSERLSEALARLARGEAAGCFQVPFRCKSGEAKHTLFTGYVHCPGEHGPEISLLGLELPPELFQAEWWSEELERRVEERSVELQRSYSEVEAFCYTVAHDLRAPLRAMEGFAHALLEDYGASLQGEGREFVERIMSASSRMDKLIEDLLAYTQLVRSTLSLHVVNLDDLIETSLETFRTDIDRSQARVSALFPFPPVAGHAPTLATVLNHLLSNALKFVQENTSPCIAIRAEKLESTVRVYIEDQGIGISPRHFERIFHLFERLHAPEEYPGTGIGLAMVRKGIERLGGLFGVESTPGEGSRFWFELPTPEAKWGTPAAGGEEPEQN